MALTLIGLSSLIHLTPAAADVVADNLRFTGLSGAGNHLVWSKYSSAARGYQLTVSDGNRVEALPISPRRVPFDADIGESRDGSLTVAYSRCEREPRLSDAFSPPDYSSGKGCVLYRYSFKDRREMRIRTGRQSVRGYWPSLSRRRIAFARGSETPSIYVRSLSSGRTTRIRPTTRLARSASAGRITRIDLGGDRLAAAWNYSEASCSPDEADRDGKVASGASEVLAGSLKRQSLVARGCDVGDTADVGFPTWRGPSLWISALARQASSGRYGFESRRYRLPRSLEGVAPLVGDVSGFAVNDLGLYTLSLRTRSETGRPTAFAIARVDGTP